MEFMQSALIQIVQAHKAQSGESDATNKEGFLCPV